MILERFSGNQLTSHDAKIEALVKVLSNEKAQKLVDQLKKPLSSHRALPKASFCKNYFENYPSYYQWKARYATISRSELAAASESNSVYYLELVLWDIAHDDFSKAFVTLNEIKSKNLLNLSTPEILDTEEAKELLSDVIPVPSFSSDAWQASQLHSFSAEKANLKQIASLYYDLIGSEYHLKTSLYEAYRYFSLSIDSYPSNFEAHLKLGSLFIELGLPQDVT